MDDLTQEKTARAPKLHLCEACGGTGIDRKRTAADKHLDAGAYYRCWPCNGNGLDPAAYFRWSDKRAAE